MTGLVARFALGPVVSGIGGTLGKAWDWITGSAVHLLLAALAIVGLYGFWQHHEAGKWQRIAASTEVRRRSDNRIWAGADRINHKSIENLIAAINGQSKMVRAWADVAHARQSAAQAALRQATARGAAAEAHAQRIDAERAARSAGAGGCASGKAVLEAKGEI